MTTHLLMVFGLGCKKLLFVTTCRIKSFLVWGISNWIISLTTPTTFICTCTTTHYVVGWMLLGCAECCIYDLYYCGNFWQLAKYIHLSSTVLLVWPVADQKKSSVVIASTGRDHNKIFLGIIHSKNASWHSFCFCLFPKIISTEVFVEKQLERRVKTF